MTRKTFCNCNLYLSLSLSLSLSVCLSLPASLSLSLWLSLSSLASLILSPASLSVSLPVSLCNSLFLFLYLFPKALSLSLSLWLLPELSTMHLLFLSTPLSVCLLVCLFVGFTPFFVYSEGSQIKCAYGSFEPTLKSSEKNFQTSKNTAQLHSSVFT